MGKKKEPSINDSLMLFKDVIKRAGLRSFQYVNCNVACFTSKDVKLCIHFDQPLWAIIMNDDELKDQFTEVNISKDGGQRVSDILDFCNDADGEWIELNGQDMYDGKIIDIKIRGLNYTIPINKTIFPVRFKKSEYNNFAYKVYLDKKILSIKKTFPGTVDNASFSIFRIFHFI